MLEKTANKDSWAEVKAILLTPADQSTQQSGTKKGRPEEMGTEVTSEHADKRARLEQEALLSALTGMDSTACFLILFRLAYLQFTLPLYIHLRYSL